MSGLIPRPERWPEVFRLLEGDWPFGWFGDRHLVRIEDYRDDGTYVLRAELPGMDPGKDIHVTVAGDELSITAERTLEKHDKGHSEFSYGSFARTIHLPTGADSDKVDASYVAGVLEVRVPVAPPPGTRQIPVTTTS